MDTEATPDPSPTAVRRPGGVVRALLAVLAFYQRWVSPMFLPRCRFYPSCSAYAVDALRTHGLLWGTGLTLVRLAKCAPWHPGGMDPVPPHRRSGVDQPGTSRSGADRTPTPDPGAAAPTTEEQASC